MPVARATRPSPTTSPQTCRPVLTRGCPLGVHSIDRKARRRSFRCIIVAGFPAVRLNAPGRPALRGSPLPRMPTSTSTYRQKQR